MELYLFENLLKARDETELKQSAQGITEQLGYDYFCYGLAYRKNGETSPQYFTLATYPQIWLDRYFDESYVNIDPSMLHCLNSTTPSVWTHRLFSAPKVIDMHHEAISLGMSGGVCLPIHSPWLNGAGLLGLANGDDTDKAVPHVVENLGVGQLFACYLNEAARKLLLPSEMGFHQSEEFTPRELECLRWAAKGLQAKQIAGKMGISPATVTSHYLPAIRRKLGAASTREAVALAITYRLIQP